MTARRRIAVAFTVASILALVIAAAALAELNTVTSNGNRITVTASEPSTNNMKCTGINHRSTGANVDFILVSAVCQYRDNSGVWHDFQTAGSESNSNDNQSGTETYTDNPCTSGGLNLPAGTWRIRGQADGYYINNGTRHDFAGDVETAGNITAVCSS